ncbi:kinase-like protein [Trichoderma reesei RUT C-30]|uniref:non-specific serine/threonine protein kinase n=1 Tax=Hypocrea jecorina (strain ATCC 56765 / BCRC 32924 / NRRL 11460 / Rut C-30) TaxID=1344414 RepID=A0A024RX52_HYPJR|nr:kinase-like protein [Trichoderma reesei RUT C-30]
MDANQQEPELPSSRQTQTQYPIDEQKLFSAPPQPDAASEEDVDEGRAAYRPGGFHPVYIGDIFNDRWKVLNKIGYGRYSTVWLVRDLQACDDVSEQFRALKVLSAICYGQGHGTFEKEILINLRHGDKSHTGYPFVCHLLDDFEHQGPNGTHVCLIFELMGETLCSFGTLFRENMIPGSVMRKFTIQLLVALDFAHDHNIIHTDIKPDNIFVKFRDYSRIESGYLQQRIPYQDRQETKYRPIPHSPLGHFYFDEANTRLIDFDVTLGDWGVSSWIDRHLCEVIQPVALRSPEVLIGAPWDASTDWWNLGAVVLEVYRAVRMFDGRIAPDGRYDVREHLAEIVDLFGPFPKSLLDRGNQDLVRGIFDDEGRVKDQEPFNRPGLASEAFMPGLSQEQRDDCASFLKLLMKIDPTERPSTVDLLRHRWLAALPPSE